MLLGASFVGHPWRGGGRSPSPSRRSINPPAPSWSNRSRFRPIWCRRHGQQLCRRAHRDHPPARHDARKPAARSSTSTVCSTTTASRSPSRKRSMKCASRSPSTPISANVKGRAPGRRIAFKLLLRASPPRNLPTRSPMSWSPCFSTKTSSQRTERATETTEFLTQEAEQAQGRAGKSWKTSSPPTSRNMAMPCRSIRNCA